MLNTNSVEPKGRMATVATPIIAADGRHTPRSSMRAPD